MGNKDKDISFEEVEKFYLWLQGKPVETGITSAEPMTLSEAQAFSVIYYLQEAIHLLPDNYERCSGCGQLFDSDSEGQVICEGGMSGDCSGFCDDCTAECGWFCDNCMPVPDICSS
ncbi:MAG: hypothetical protein LUE14_12360 [Clostridiales bacterium]|nr:hypothetical protein [Clostridiales bacterium]